MNRLPAPMYFLAITLLGALSAVEPLVPAAQAWQRGWPSISGPKGNFQALPTDTPLLDNLSLATLKWTSETAALGAGKGGGVPRKNRQDLLNSFGPDRIRWAGTLSGPVVAAGVVYVASFQPAGEFREFNGMQMLRETKRFEQPVRLQLEAEDTLTAIDAETGKTLWTFAHPGGLCWTHGKRGGLQIAPAVDQASGRAWFVGTLGNLYCVDIQTGQGLWVSDIGWAYERMKRAKNYYLNGEKMQLDKRSERQYRGMPKLRDGMYVESYTPSWHGGVQLIGDVVVVNDGGTGLVAFHPENGEKIWSRGGVNSMFAAPSTWEHAGKQYILTAGVVKSSKKGGFGAGFLRLMNPQDGQDIWVEEIGPTYPTLAPFGDRVLVNTRQPIEKNDLNKGLLGCYVLSLTGAEQAWVLPDEPQNYITLKKDTLGLFRYSIQGNRAFIGTKGGTKNAADGRFLIIDAESGKILVEDANRNRNTRIGTHFWYVVGDRIYSSWDRHHSPMRGGRKPIMQSRWTDAGMKVMGDSNGPFGLDLADITGGYEVTMEHPIVDGRMFERTTDGRLVCYDLRKDQDEQVYRLQAKGAWRGLGAALPLALRVRDGAVLAGAAYPGNSALIGQVYTTARTSSFWRDFPVNKLTLTGDKLAGEARIETVGAALPHNYIGLHVEVERQGAKLNGTWSRKVAPLEQEIVRNGSLEGNFDHQHRFANTPWLSWSPKTKFAPLADGQTCYVVNLAAAFYREGKKGIPNLTLSLVHDGEDFIAGSGAAFGASQGWHEIDASNLRLIDGILTGSLVLLFHGDNYGTMARPDGQTGLLAARISFDAQVVEAAIQGTYEITWGVSYQAHGPIIGSVDDLR